MFIWLDLIICVYMCDQHAYIYRAYFVTMLGTLEPMLLVLDTVSDTNRYA